MIWLMKWYTILADLVQYLDNKNVAAYVKAGAINPKSLKLSDDDAAVFIIRDRESESIQQSGFVGDKSCELSLFIECWITSSDQDFLVGYEALSAVEDRVSSAISAWAHDTKININYARIDESYGDADTSRPYVGSRMCLNIKYSK